MERAPSEKSIGAGESRPGKLLRSSSSRRSQLTRGKSDKEIQNLRQEIDILKKLRHQNIILLLDWFETANEFGVVTEFAQGELFEILEEDKRMSEDQIRKIALQLAQALFYLHSNRIIHRDMKPQNILIGSGGVIKLCDFGFARAMSQSTVVLTSIKGTPLYMAPELVQDQPYNHSVDLWSFGIILYELFVGEPPFYTNKLASLIQLIIKKTIKYPDNISPEFKSFLSQLLVKEPSKRLDWPDLLEHPFLQKTNIDIMAEQQLVERYADWMSKLAIWNPDFREFGPKSQAMLQSEAQTSVAQSQHQDVDKIPLKELIRNSKKECLTKNQKQALTMFDHCLAEIAAQLNSNQGGDLEETDFAEFSALAELVLESFSDYNSFDKLTRDFAHKLKAIGLSLSAQKASPVHSCWFVSAAVRFSVRSADIVDVVNAFLQLAKGLLTATEVSPAEYLALLGFPLAVQLRLGMRLDEPLALLQHVRQQRLFEQVFAPKLFAASFLSQPPIVETVARILAPETTDLITFPLLKSKNVTIKKQPLDAASLSALLDFNEYVQFAVFTTLDKCSWLDSASLDEASFLKIALQFLRISDDCVRQFLQNEQLSASLKTSVANLSHKSNDLQELFVQLYSEVNRSKQLKLYIDHEHMADIFHKEEHPFLALLQFGYLASVMDDPAYTKRFLTSASQFAPELLHLLDTLKAFLEQSSQQNYAAVITEDFVSSGFVLFGVFDSVFKFLRQLLFVCRKSKELLIEFITRLTNKGLHTLLFGLFEKIDGPFNISLKGMVSFLGLTVELLSVTKEHLLLVELLTREQTIRNLLLLLSEEKNRAVQEWPKRLSNSSSIFENIKCSVVKIVEMVLGTIVKSGKTHLVGHFANQLKSCSNFMREVVHAHDLMAASLEGSAKDARQRRSIRLPLIVNMFKTPDLEKYSTHEFLLAGGVEFIDRNGGLSLPLSDEFNHSVLSDHLTILIQLSVESKDCYPAIHAISPYSGLVGLLTKAPDALREKACRLVGHLCKHSAFFYDKLSEINVVDVLVSLCGHPYTGIRRSVCLALGNSAFHSDALYKKLAQFLPTILKLANDEDEKVRANVVGTINNLVRNSNALFPLITDLKVPHLLRELVLRDPSMVA